METFIEILKKLLFFFLMPLYLPLSLLINSTYEWWAGKREENKLIFFLLAIIYIPGSLFLLWTFEWWVKLSE
jgi:hypothetical protein